MERNLALYAPYQAARSLLFWLPIFFLFFGAHVSAAQVLQLEAIYYVAVVVLEVPSGYLSDRVGRRPTLVLASACWLAACVAFAAGGSFLAFAAAQILLAAGMALNSGTDGSLLYDSLAALDRSEEFAEREGKAQAWARVALGIAALVGGALASVDLRLAYVGSAAAAAMATVLALAFTEPPGRGEAAAVLTQLRAVARHMKKPVLAWTFAFAVAITVFNHVPYELAQPYVHAVLDQSGRASWTEVTSGVLTALAMALAALASARAGALAQKSIGVVLVLALALQGLVMLAMGLWIHPAVLGLVALRAVPGALEGPLVQAAAHPHVASSLRATYFSVLSLAGRLAFAGSLVLASAIVGGDPALDPSTLGELSIGFAVALGLLGLGLGLTMGALRSPATGEPSA